MCKNKVDDEKVQELCQSLQHHCHSFMCYKKKTRTIGEMYGHGHHDREMTGPALKVPTCRFMFPQPPVRETVIVEPVNDNIHKDTIEE